MSQEITRVVKVKKERAERAMKKIKDDGALDPTRVPQESGDYLLIPVKEGGEKIYADLCERVPKKSPFVKITELLDVPKKMLPTRWEMIGDVLLLKIPNNLQDKKKDVAAAYAEVLGAKTVLQQGPIEGVTRQPLVEIIYGENTETVHRENGIRFMLDTAKIMFSSGNIDERTHMASVVKKREVVVDMFAGIGYFTLPMAVHGRGEEVHSLEINPVAFEYLCKNVSLNGVEDVVKPHLGDNRDFTFDKTANRVVMGYLHDTWKFLPKAVEFLGGEGMIHYHCNVKGKDLEGKVRKQLLKRINNFEIREVRKIKSYAPHVYHVVADVLIRSQII